MCFVKEKNVNVLLLSPVSAIVITFSSSIVAVSVLFKAMMFRCKQDEGTYLVNHNEMKLKTGLAPRYIQDLRFLLPLP